MTTGIVDCWSVVVGRWSRERANQALVDEGTQLTTLQPGDCIYVGRVDCFGQEASESWAVEGGGRVGDASRGSWVGGGPIASLSQRRDRDNS